MTATPSMMMGVTVPARANTGPHLEVSHDSDFLFGTGKFVVEFWFKALDYVDESTFISSRTDNGGWRFFLRSDGDIRFFFWDNGVENKTLIWNGNLKDYAWHHAAIVRSGTGVNQIEMYIDGVKRADATYDNDNMDTGAVYLRIGGNYLTRLRNFHGYQSHLRISKCTDRG